MKRLKWFEREFVFDIPPGWLFNIFERLEGTENRIKNLCYKLSEAQLNISLNNEWTIKQELAHLINLEELHIQRLKDLKENKNELSPADLNNTIIHESDLHQTQFAVLVVSFKKIRKQFIDVLKSFNEEEHLRKAKHPRLQKMMAAVDIAFFVAEHDDHHLASMRKKINKLKSS